MIKKPLSLIILFSLLSIVGVAQRGPAKLVINEFSNVPGNRFIEFLVIETGDLRGVEFDDGNHTDVRLINYTNEADSDSKLVVRDKSATSGRRFRFALELEEFACVARGSLIAVYDPSNSVPVSGVNEELLDDGRMAIPLNSSKLEIQTGFNGFPTLNLPYGSNATWSDPSGVTPNADWDSDFNFEPEGSAINVFYPSLTTDFLVDWAWGRADGVPNVKYNLLDTLFTDLGYNDVPSSNPITRIDTLTGFFFIDNNTNSGRAFLDSIDPNNPRNVFQYNYKAVGTPTPGHYNNGLNQVLGKDSLRMGGLIQNKNTIFTIKVEDNNPTGIELLCKGENWKPYFDLNWKSEELYWGDRDIYFTIYDASNNPIKSSVHHITESDLTNMGGEDFRYALDSLFDPNFPDQPYAIRVDSLVDYSSCFSVLELNSEANSMVRDTLSYSFSGAPGPIENCNGAETEIAIDFVYDGFGIPPTDTSIFIDIYRNGVFFQSFVSTSTSFSFLTTLDGTYTIGALSDGNCVNQHVDPNNSIEVVYTSSDGEVENYIDLSDTNPDTCKIAETLINLKWPRPCEEDDDDREITGYIISNRNAVPSSNNPYLKLSGCSGPNPDMASPASDVWYKFTANSDIMTFHIYGCEVEFPNIGLYRGSSCGSLIGEDCSTGSNYELTKQFRTIPGLDYYIQVSGGFIGDRGAMFMDITTENDCSGCKVTAFLEANPTPVNGVYDAGTEVEFTFSIVNWVDPGTVSYPHGVIPKFGSGWDLSNLTVTPSPKCSPGTQGYWDWYNSVTGDGSGNTYGPGFFFESNSSGVTIPLDDNPGNNWGDPCLNSDADFVFKWKVKFPGCTEGSNADLSMDVIALGDGESGSWTSLSCFGELEFPFSATGDCCESPVIVDITKPTCYNLCNGSVTWELVGGGNFPVTYRFFDQQNQMVSTGVLNEQPAGPLTIFNLCQGEFYVLETEDAGGCTKNTFFEVDPVDPPMVSFQDISTVCKGETVEVRLKVENGVPPIDVVLTDGVNSVLVEDVVDEKTVSWVFDGSNGIGIEYIQDSKSPVNCSAGPFPLYKPKYFEEFAFDFTVDKACPDSSTQVHYDISPTGFNGTGGFIINVQDQFGNNDQVTIPDGVYSGSFEWTFFDEGNLYIRGGQNLYTGCSLFGLDDTVSFEYHPVPSISFSPVRDKVCINQEVIVDYDPDGIAPFEFVYYVNGDRDTLSNINGPGSIYFDTDETITMSLVSIKDASAGACPFSEPVTTKINVYDSLRVDLLQDSCFDNLFDEKVRITVGVVGGDSTTFLFNDTYNYQTRTFKDPVDYPEGTEYTIKVEDASGCPPAELSGVKYCSCKSAAPGLIRNLQRKCSSDPVDIILDANVPAFLDEGWGYPIDDTLVYVVHEGSGINLVNIKTIIPGTATQLTNYSGLNFDQVYYLSAVVADIDSIPNTNNVTVSLSDTCLSVSRGIPFIINPTPEVTFSLKDDSICSGETTFLYMDISGKAPFSVIYENDFGGFETLEGLNNIDSVPLIGTFSRSFDFLQVEDVNDPSCVGIMNETIDLHVHKFVNADLNGDTSFCAGDSARLVVNFAGTAPWYLNYSIDGTPQPEVKTYDINHEIFIKTASEVALIGVRDSFCEGSIDTEIWKIQEFPNPLAEAGPNQGVCGNVAVLGALPAQGVGVWSAVEGFFDDPADPLTNVTVDGPGTYKFYWTDKVEGCGTAKDSVEISFSPFPETRMQNDTAICGTTVDVEVYPSIGVGVLTDLDAIGWTITQQGPDLYEIGDFAGEGRLVWTETTGEGCIGRDTLNLKMNDPLDVQVNEICNATADSVQLEIIINGGEGPFYFNQKVITSGYTTDPFVSGNTINFTISDQSACDDFIFDEVVTCPCINVAGNFFGGTIEGCEFGPLDFMPWYTDAHILDGNDSVVFVVSETPVFEEEKWFDTIPYEVGEAALVNGMVPDQTYYLFPIVTSYVSDTLNFKDVCLQVGIPKRISFRSALRVGLPDTLVACDGLNTVVPITIENAGTVNFDFNNGGITTNLTGSSPVENVVQVFTTEKYVTIDNFIFTTTPANCALVVNDSAWIKIDAIPEVEVIRDSTTCVGVENPLSIKENFTEADGYSITWVYGQGESITGEDTSIQFLDSGLVNGFVTVVSPLGCSFTQNFSPLFDVQLVPDAGFITSPNLDEILCNGTTISVIDTTSFVDDFDFRSWQLNGYEFATENSKAFRIDSTGTFELRMILATSYGCADTVAQTVTTTGPTAELVTIDRSNICVGGSIEVEARNFQNVNTYEWVLEDGTRFFNQTSVTLDVNEMQPDGVYTILFQMEDNNGCIGYQQIDIPIITSGVTPIVVDGLISGCANDLIDLDAEGPGLADAEFEWLVDGEVIAEGASSVLGSDLGVGFSTMEFVSYNTVTGCRDTIPLNVEILSAPTIFFENREDTTCVGVPLEVQITSTAGLSEFNWTPRTSFESHDTHPGLFVGNSSQTVSLEVRGENGCWSDVISTDITVIPTPNIPDLSFDTLVFAGSPVPFNPVLDLSVPYTVTWNPNNELECPDCLNQTLTAIKTKTFELTLSDVYGCVDVTSIIRLIVDESVVADVPDAFTPNGDGVNDVIFARGLGVKSIEAFQIYNRYGVKVFETKDIEEGWDGTYDGEPLPIDSYVYKLYVRSFEDRVTMKQGTLKLLR